MARVFQQNLKDLRKVAWWAPVDITQFALSFDEEFNRYMSAHMRSKQEINYEIQL